MLPLSIELGWGLTIGTLTFLILAVAIIANMLVSGRKIKESEKKFKLLFNKAFDSLIVIDKGGQIIDVNESARNLLGYSKKELLKLSIENLVLIDECSKLKAELQKTIKSGLDYFGEIRLLGKNNKVIDAEMGGVTLEINGKIFILGSFRDITGRKQTENELIMKNAALNEILAHIEEEKIKIKKQVAQTIDKVLMPSLNKLLNGNGSVSKYYHDQLKKNLQVLANSTGGILHAYSRLSPREVEICNLIKNGGTSKEIAKILNISIVTVNKHRERIRKKLVISNKHINLASYLNNK